MAKKSLNVVILRFYSLGRHQTFVNDRSRAALLYEQVKGVVRCPKDYSRTPEGTRTIVNLKEINNVRRQSILPPKTKPKDPAFNTLELSEMALA